MPPLIGWAAGSGRLNVEAWTLYAIIFLWQFPHFMAIAWIYREDYDRAGYMVLPRGQARAMISTLQTLLPVFALVPVSLVPAFEGHTSVLYVIGALVLSLAFIYY